MRPSACIRLDWVSLYHSDAGDFELTACPGREGRERNHSVAGCLLKVA